MTKEGKPYAPYRFKKIVEESYLISHQIHTSYTDVLQMTPRERNYLIEFISKEAKEQKEATKKALEKYKTK